MIGTITFRPKSTLCRELESDLHAAVAQVLRLALRLPTTWTTFPAGGGGLKRGRILARLGLRPGWPDVLVLHPAATSVEGRRQVIVVGLELKTEGGRQSLAQRTVEREFTAAGATYALCRSIDDVHAVLMAAGIPMYATPMAAASAKAPQSARAGL